MYPNQGFAYPNTSPILPLFLSIAHHIFCPRRTAVRPTVRLPVHTFLPYFLLFLSMNLQPPRQLHHFWYQSSRLVKVLLHPPPPKNLKKIIKRSRTLASRAYSRAKCLYLSFPHFSSRNEYQHEFRGKVGSTHAELPNDYFS